MAGRGAGVVDVEPSVSLSHTPRENGAPLLGIDEILERVPKIKLEAYKHKGRAVN